MLLVHLLLSNENLVDVYSLPYKTRIVIFIPSNVTVTRYYLLGTVNAKKCASCMPITQVLLRQATSHEASKKHMRLSGKILRTHLIDDQSI